jgi:transposase
VEQAALAETPAGTRLEVVVEPTGPAWLPIAVFFAARGHIVYRVSSAKAHDLRRVLSRHAKSNGIDADTLARLPLVDPAGLWPLQLPEAAEAALDRRVRACDRLTRQAASHKRRIKDLVQQLLPASPLVGELGQADLAVLERWADPMRWWLRAMPGCSGCWPPHRPVSRAPSGPPTGWPPPAPRSSCMATTPRSPLPSWPPR